jgi:hypothetical protein
MKLPSRRPGWRITAAAAAVACSAILVPTVALASSSAPARPATPQCTSGDTFVWLALVNNGAAGHVADPVEFTNVSNHPCWLFGFPGVSGVNGSLKQIGPAAVREPVKPHKVTLQKGQTAHALLVITNTGFIGGCKKANGVGLKVFPPNQTQKQFVFNFLFSGCKNKKYLQVFPVTPGIGVP